MVFRCSQRYYHADRSYNRQTSDMSVQMNSHKLAGYFLTGGKIYIKFNMDSLLFVILNIFNNRITG